MNKVWAIIPARGGSKGLYKKNIQLLAGKPLIAYAIEAALKSSRVTRVIVSTDDREIAAIARKWGAEVPFLRPASLATDNASISKAVDWTVDTLGRSCGYPDAILTLLPSHPFRTPQMINHAIEILKFNFKVTTALEYELNPSNMGFIYKDTRYKIRSQMDSLKLYQLTGAILGSRYIPPGYRIFDDPNKYTEYLKSLKQSNPQLNNFAGAIQILDGIHSQIDIDSIDDLLAAEKMMSGSDAGKYLWPKSIHSCCLGMELVSTPISVYGQNFMIPFTPDKSKTYLIQFAECSVPGNKFRGEYIYRRLNFINENMISEKLFDDNHDIQIRLSGEGLNIRWNSAKSAPYTRIACGVYDGNSRCKTGVPFSMPPLWKHDISNGMKYNIQTGRVINGRQDVPEITYEPEGAPAINRYG